MVLGLIAGVTAGFAIAAVVGSIESGDALPQEGVVLSQHDPDRHGVRA